MRRFSVLAVVLLMAGVACTPDPPPVIPFDGIEQMSASPSMYSCLVTDASAVACWGLGREDRHGTGAGPGSDHPVEVAGLTDVAQVASGGSIYIEQGHVCALKNDGTVWCVGEGWDGQLGDGVAGNTATPTQAVGIADAVQIAAGTNRTCALLADATVSCWGAGQLVPTPVAGVADIVDIDVADWSLCWVDANGASGCEVLDLLGDPEFDAATEIAGASGAACVVLADATLQCAGSNVSGQLGDGTTTSSNDAVAVAGLTGVAHVDVGSTHACASLVNGEVWCWGDNSAGQLGGSDSASLLPRKVAGVSGADDVTVGRYYSCAQIDDTAKCWGFNQSGQLGGGFESARSGPVVVAAS